MNIAFVGAFGLRPKATVSTRAVPLADALVRRGHRVTIVTPPWDNPADSGKEITLGRVRVLNVSLPPMIPFLWYLIVTWRLLRQTLRQQPDVVHVFKPKAFAGLIASMLWLSNLLGITNIRVVVDTDDWEGAGGWNEIGAYTPAQRLFFPFQERWVLRQAQTVTVASRTLEKMVSSLRSDGEKVFYLPNAIRSNGEMPPGEPAAGLRSRLGLAESPVILLYTRFFEFGVGRVLDVLEQVVLEVPEARLLVVGKGFFGEEAELDRLAQSRGLAANITQAGWVDEPDLPAYFAVADVAIYPFDDTLINRTKCSVKLLDLLDAGVPVIADRVGQNAEYVEDGKSGILTEPGNSDAMAAAIKGLLADPATAKELGRQAKRRVRSDFNWANWALQAERAYECAARKTSPARIAFTWLPALLWMGLIFYMSSQPSPPQIPQPLLHTIIAKLIHFGEFAVLTLLLSRAYRLGSSFPVDLRRQIAFSALVALLYAISDEIHQGFVPNRHPSPVDVLIDASGVSLALALIWSRNKKSWLLRSR